MPALQRFFEAERQRQGWSVRQAAKHCRISVSKAYAIEAGDDNVEFDTFENIAGAFGMSPAELAIAIGKGPANDDPKRAQLQALARNVADEHVGAAELMLRGLTAAEASVSIPSAKKRTEGATKRLSGKRDEIANDHTQPGKTVAKGRPIKSYHFGSDDPGRGGRALVRSFVNNLLALVTVNRDFRPANAGA